MAEICFIFGHYFFGLLSLFNVHAQIHTVHHDMTPNFLFKFLSFFLQNTNKNLNRKEKNTSLFMYKKYVYTICTLYVYHMYTVCILYVHLSSANSKLSLRQKDFQRNAAGHSGLL